MLLSFAMMMRRSLFCFALYSAHVVASSETGSGREGPAVVVTDQVVLNAPPLAGNTRTRTTQNFHLVRRTTAATSDDDSVTADSNNKNTTHCIDHTDCQSCNAASWCHWCGISKGCHVQGSASGCAWGQTCPGPPSPPAPANNDTCLAHASCADCAVYSRWCHWCAHDNACHLIGSFYGCVRGVDCYDITHCQRAVPEPMDEVNEGPFVVPELRPIPTIIAGVLTALIMCCATCCCCAVRVTKEAYNDLVRDVTDTTPLLSSNEDMAVVDDLHQHTTTATTTIVSEETPEETLVVPAVTAAEAEEDDPAAAEQDLEETAHRPEEEDAPADEPLAAASSPRRSTRWSTGRSTRRAATSATTQSTTTTTTTTTTIRPHIRRSPRRTIHRLYHACVGCYCLTLLAVLTTSFAIIKYFPQPPAYSICSDAVAWKSIVEAMAHLSVAADFQLLASIENPNYLDVDVVAGGGSFYHKNDFVGSFQIPANTTIQRRSITDLLITATFAPDKWKTLSIAEEYYAGTLMLTLDSQVTIRIPVLFDYTFTVTVKDLLVDINQAADRHLCACPTWSDARTPVPRWMTMGKEEDTSPWLSLSSSSLSISDHAGTPSAQLMDTQALVDDVNTQQTQ
jgi:hypothetical protein